MKKKLLRIFLFFVMLISLIVPSENNGPRRAEAANISGGTYLYCDASFWDPSGARFAAYFYNSSSNSWVNFNSYHDNIFYCKAPSGTWTNVIFCRMNPSNSTNDWPNKWNQTGNLTYDGSKKLFTVSQWDNQTQGWSTLDFPEYALVGDFNDWDVKKDPITNNTIKQLELDSKTYNFKIVNFTATAVNWYGNDGSISDTTLATSSSGWKFETNKSNCQLVASGGKYDFSFNTSTKNLSIYYNVTVNFDKNGGSNLSSSSKTVYYKGTYGDLPSVTKTGYTLNWIDSSSNTITSSSTVETKTTHTLKANWTANSYAVTLDNQNPTTAGSTSVTATYGSAMPRITVPTKTGYTFGGYYDGLNGTGTQYYTAGGSSARTWNKATATTLYAYWVINQYSVSVNITPTNGGNVTINGTNSNSGNYNYGTDITLVATANPGYTFDGWYSDNSTKVFSSTTYSVTLGITGLSLIAKFNANQYTLTFDSNDGDPLSPNTKTVTFNSAIEELPEPTRLNEPEYIFLGWFTDPINGTEVTSETIYTTVGNSTIYAHWKKVPNRTISFEPNGENVELSHNSIVAYETLKYSFKNAGLATASRTGYTFKEWNTSSDGTGSKITNDTILQENSTDHSLYAIWTVNTYSITLAQTNATTQGTTSATATYDSAMPKIATLPSRTGYTFSGYQTSGGTKYYNADGTSAKNWNIDEDTTLYPIWTANTYTITFNPSNPSLSTDLTTSGTTSKAVTFDSSVTSITVPQLTGYTFQGYYTNTTGQGTKYFDKDGNYVLNTYTNPDNITLYAYWTVNIYDVVLNTNNGSYKNEASVPLKHTYDITTTLPTSDNIYKTGYTFNGWYTNAQFTGNPVTEISATTANNTEFFAKWTANTYTVSYNANGGTGTMANTTNCIYDKEFNLPTNAFEKVGYNFVGWTTNEDGTGNLYADDASVSNLTSEDEATVTLYANWEPITYTIVLHKNFGDSVETHVINGAKYDTSYGNDSIFTVNGYYLKGWSTSSNGDIKYNPDEILNETSDDGVSVNLYAVWEIQNYTINYDLGGGSWKNQDNPNPSTYNLGTSSFSISSPIYGSSTFDGWTCEELGITEPTLNLLINPRQMEIYQDITLVANWSASITIYVDAKAFADKLGNNNNLHYTSFKIHYWENEGNGTDWENKPSFTHTGKDNIYSVTINFDNTITRVDYIIIVFTRNENGGKDDPTQSTSIETGGWTAENNGEEYFIALPSGGFSWVSDNDWSISNLSLVEAPRVAYYDDPNEDPVYLSSYSKNHNIQFVEKEGYRLEGWYTSPTNFSEATRFTSETIITYIDNRFNVYANYVEAHDYYIYVEAKNLNWNMENMSVYKWSNYFFNHDNLWPGSKYDIVYLGNGIYRVYIDASKSYDQLIFCDSSTPNLNGDKEHFVQTENIDMTPNMSYYVISGNAYLNDDPLKGVTGRYINPISYEKSLDNDIYAQKNSSNTSINEFRFTSGLENYGDLVEIPQDTVGKEFGYKFIFINGDECYVGYWNFTTNTMLDCVRYEETLYDATAEGYKGYYSLTLTDDINFKYSHYNQIIVVACYRDNAGNTQIIKAQEYNIVGTGTNVQLYKIER